MKTGRSSHPPADQSRRAGSICLVMLVKNEGAIIDRCLASVHGFIDRWLIIDTGSEDDTLRKVRRALRGIPGEAVSEPWRDVSTHRNQLHELARGLADYCLWLDADETLSVRTERPWDGLTEIGYALELQTPRGSFMPVRLTRGDAEIRFVGEFAETLVGVHPIAPLCTVAIRHHEDGARRRDPARNQRDILRLEVALLDDPSNPDLTMELAERHAAGGAFSIAERCYRRRAELGGDEAQLWYALYQTARMLDERGFATPLVTEAYLRAYDARPSKAEPLVRIARRCLQDGRYDTAADIAWAAVTTPFEDRAYFFEPTAYHGQREILFLRAALELGRCAEVVECAERLSVDRQWAPEIQREFDELRDLALRRQAEAPRAVGNATSRQPVEEPEARRTIPAATATREKRKLCIGMATFDDYDGVYFSLQAIRLFHSEVADDVELLVIDNNPSGRCAEALKQLDAWLPNYRYVPEVDRRGTAARDLIFREANADYVLAMDCHVMIVPGALRRLLTYFESHRDCIDLLQGPQLYDDLINIATHFEPVWRQGMYGTWATDPRGAHVDSPPFEIPMQGLGVFACRRDAWLGFNPRFRGFGGEEGYIHEKFRQAGGRVLCLPFLRWTHRFHRPLGVPYVVDWGDRLRNYLIGHRELGLDLAPIEAHFSELIGAEQSAAIRAQVDAEREVGGAVLPQPMGAAAVEHKGIDDRLVGPLGEDTDR